MSYFTHVDGEFKEVFEIDKSLEHLRDSIKMLEEENERLRKENTYLKEEYSRDEEVQKLNKKLEQAKEEARNGFIIPKYLNDKIEKWKKQHVREKHWDTLHNMPMSSGAIGGRFTYEFIPTGIGNLITCKCSCGAEISEMSD